MAPSRKYLPLPAAAQSEHDLAICRQSAFAIAMLPFDKLTD